ncbi:MAG: GHKL domain-containing protein [Flavobacteriales bacterium]|nr:GHKL domain-containing protein [Flavobacteriales bacterium]
MFRPLLFLALGLLCGAGAAVIDEPEAETELAHAAAALQQRLDLAAEELGRFTEQEAQAIVSLGPRQWFQEKAKSLELARARTGTELLILEGDSTIAWSGDAALFQQRPEPASRGAAPSGSWLEAEVGIGQLTVKGRRPVWMEPPVRNRYLKDCFHPSLNAQPGLRMSAASGHGLPLHGPNGASLGQVDWRDGAMELGPWLWWRAALWLASGVLLVCAIGIWCARLTRGRPWLAATFFASTLLLLRAGTLVIGPTAPLDRWPLFDPAVYAASTWFPSLGDLLINAAVLVALSAFTFRALRSSTLHAPAAISLATLVLLAHGAWNTDLCIGLVRDSTIDLDLYHIQGIGAFGAVALLITALLFISWSLLAATLARILPRTRMAYLSVVAAFVLSILLHHLFGYRDTVLFLWPAPVLLILLPDRQRALPFIRGVLLLAALAGTSTHIITKYMGNRERNERAVLAERLAVREDPVLNQLFRETAPIIRRDTVLYRLFASDAYCDRENLERFAREPYFSGYWERYDLRLFGYSPANELRCASDLEPPLALPRDSAAFPVGVSDMPDLFIDERIGGEVIHHARVAVMPTDSAPPAQLVIELRPRSLSQGLGFPDLLLAGTDRLTQRAERYAQARYVDGLLMEQSGTQAQPQHWTRRAMDEDWFEQDGMEYLARTVGGNVIMVLGLPQRGLIDKATTFSYLFTLYGLLLLLALALHAAFTGGLPDLGIGTKVRAALVLFAIIGLLFFGFGSQRLLSRQFDEREETYSVEKARAVTEELRRRIGDEHIDGPAYSGYLQFLLGQLGNTYLTDLTLYAPDGRWLASTRPQMLTAGLLGPRMDHHAFTELAVEGSSAFVHQESIGAAVFRTAYTPLLDSHGAVLAYLALPSFADQAQQAEERAQLLVAVVNLFVLLFALSVLLAVFISNWTTRPLDVLKRALAGVALQGSNRPIHYRGADEVGELVAVYNRKVEELRESAERLARSERESAWREMARQVAHEVKNPLTPMKLGIQQFQRTWDPQAPDAKERLDRFSKSMVEQIDALNGVATAFSQFAQMPAASPTTLDLCEVVRAAVDVFDATPGLVITHTEEGPLTVHADRDHMLRVVNNLIKNAVQAIPEGRQGAVHVEARRSRNEALIEIRDNGSGIPPDARDRIFTPSFTTKSSGMGLGLAMVKRMVEGAGGRVWFESEEGEGTRFFVALPLAP